MSVDNIELRNFLPNIRHLNFPDVAANGSFESFKLPNSSEYLVQYSRDISPNFPAFGLGTSKSLKIAQIKAYAEFIERKAFFESGIKLGFSTTNGIATHIIPILATKCAIDEAYERDAFLMHWHAEEPMSPLTENAVTHLKTEIELTSKIGFQTLAFNTTLGYQRTTVCFLISKKTGGFCVGLSSGRGQKQDTAKAFLEASINLFLCKDGDKPIVAEWNQKLGLKHHRDYWLFNNSLPQWILASPNGYTETKSPVNFDRFALPSEHFYTVGVKSKDLIGLNIGPLEHRDVDLIEKRLQKNSFKFNLGKNIIHPIP